MKGSRRLAGRELSVFSARDFASFLTYQGDHRIDVRIDLFNPRQVCVHEFKRRDLLGTDRRALL